MLDGVMKRTCSCASMNYGCAVLFLIFLAKLKGASHTLGEGLGITSCQTDDIDLAFLVDSSGSVKEQNFHRMLDSVAVIIQYFNTDDGHLRTAVATYGTDVRVRFHLNQYTDEVNLLNSIRKIEYDPANSTETGLAIAAVTDEIYQVENGHRPDAFRLLILLTDGKSQDREKTKTEAARARESDVFIIVIGIGDEIDQEELHAVTATEEAVILVPSFARLEALAAAALLTICPVCDERNGWLYHNEMCYLVHKADEKITWLEARRRCRDVKGDLTTIHGSRDENFFSSSMPIDRKTAYIGLRKDYSHTAGHFKDIFRWEDGTPLIYRNWMDKEPDGASLERCVLMNGTSGWEDMFCGERVTNQFICMKPALDKTYRLSVSPELLASIAVVNHDLYRNCTNGELVSKFKFCDKQFDCRDNSDEDECAEVCDDSMYSCQNKRCVSLTFYCDGIDDCGDDSDEKTCNVCQGFECYDGKCIPLSWVGDGAVDCNGFKREDEIVSSIQEPISDQSVRNESLVSHCMYNPDMFGKVRVPNDKNNCSFHQCPDMFYKCPTSYCIPIFSVCNGVFDCPQGEDEDSCDLFSCPGYYRCKGEHNCIHPTQLCDGCRHCPLGDDERYCEHLCPLSCKCDGRVITCNENFNRLHLIPRDVRKLDLSGLYVQTGFPDLKNLHYLTILVLSDCGLTSISDLLPELPNLIELDLSNNKIQHLTNYSFVSVPGLKYLDLSRNGRLTSLTNGTFMQLTTLEYLNLQNTDLGTLTGTPFFGLSKLRSLNLSMSGIDKIKDDCFSGLEVLRVLDIRQNRIAQFGEGIFNGLEKLENLFTDSYKLCCDSVRPKSLSLHNCTSSGSVISSCQDLLGQDILRIMLWCIAVFAVIGNIIILGYRLRFDRQSLQRSYGVFVTNLSISDSLMGVYMLIIGSADVMYRGSYIWNDYEWRHSPVCKIAGFLATVSSEASCIFITLITLDRFLAIKFPLKHFGFSRISITASVTITWLIALILAGVPVFPLLKNWELYSQNSVCLALPLSSERNPGWQYSSALFVGFNFVLFVCIGVGQIFIYRSVKSSSQIRIGGSSDVNIARKLFLVVFTDFLCWFPVGIMGILVLEGYHINRDVYAWTAVTVLPVNSALNPILYTVPSIIQARREQIKRKEISGEKRLSSQANVLESLPIHKSRAYVGNPTSDMETLRSMLQAREVSSDVKVDIISLIVDYVLELHEKNRRFQPLSGENVFFKRCGNEISSICLALDPDPDRYSLSDDVLYLIQLLKLQNSIAEKSEETDATSRIVYKL